MLNAELRSSLPEQIICAIKKTLTPFFVYFSAVSLLFAALTLSSCGSSIKNAQDFVPNDPPVIEGYVLTDNSTGGAVNSSNVLLGTTLKCVITAYDPEKKPLTYTFNSSQVSLSNLTVTDTGCEGIFIVTNVPSGGDLLLDVTVRDVKNAASAMTINIGKGQSGPVLTLGNPSRERISSSNSATFTFKCSSDGWYQVLESSADVSANPKNYMSSSSIYHADTVLNAIAGGPSYNITIKETTVAVSTGDGEKKIWIIFKDDNNYFKALNASVILDTVKPQAASITPANGALSVSTSPNVSIVFDDNMDSTTLGSALASSGGTVSYLSYDDTIKTAVYSITGLAKNTNYTLTLSNAADIAGNIVETKISSFTTTPTYAVTYDKNSATGGDLPIDAARYDNGQSVTVLGNTGALYRTGYTFAGWNTKADGSGTTYAVSSTFTMGAADVTLYVKWAVNSYTVTYVSNTTGTLQNISIPASLAYNYGASYTVPDFTASGAGVARASSIRDSSGTSYYFSGWATAATGGTAVSAGSHTMDLSNITLYAQWAAYSSGVYGPAGGIVGHIMDAYTADPIDASLYYRYFEAAPSSSPSSLTWGLTTDTIASTNTGVGYGRYNTLLITALYPDSNSSNQYAANYCSRYELNGYSDWFLPSVQELSLEPATKYSSSEFWTSYQSSSNSSRAQAQSWGNSISSFYLKDASYNVLPMRRF